jgi:rod shape-determining protein MreC
MAQQNKNRLSLFNTPSFTFLSFIFFVSLSLALMGLDKKYSFSSQIKSHVELLKSPLNVIINAPVDLKNRIANYFISQEQLLHENEALNEKIMQLDFELQKLNFIKEENTHLRQSLKIQELKKNQIITAEIIHPKQVNNKVIITINKGASDRVKLGSAVLNNLGLIGQIIEVNETNSMMMPITSNKFQVSAVTDKAKENFILSGNNSPLIEIRRYPISGKINIGDQILTSGLDHFYPRGIKIGKVEKIEPIGDSQYNRIIVSPFSTSEQLSHVSIITQ